MGDKFVEPNQVLDDEMRQLIEKSVTNGRRDERNKKLVETDKYVLPDFPISSEDKTKIINYRQELRDFNYKDFSLTPPEFPIIS